MATVDSRSLTTQSDNEPTSAWHEWMPKVEAFVAKGTPEYRYSPRADILFLYRGDFEPGFTVDAEDGFAWRVSHDKTRVVAIEIHNFQSIFLKQHPDVAVAWKRAQNPLYRLMRNRQARRQEIIADKVIEAAPAPLHLSHCLPA